MKFYWLAVACLLALSISGCQKAGKLRTQSIYTFQNNTNQRLSFNVYSSKEDYNLNANPEQQHSIEPGAAEKVAFDIAKTYWVDWYSSTYSMNNWRSAYDPSYFDIPWPEPEITVAAEDDQYSIHSVVSDTSRSILLEDNDLQSRWDGEITGAGAQNDTFRFEFRKDFSGTYSFTDLQGTTISKPIRYTITNHYTPSANSNFTMTVFDDQPGNFCTVFYPAMGGIPNRDKLTLNYSRVSFNPYWTLSRTKP